MTMKKKAMLTITAFIVLFGVVAALRIASYAPALGVAPSAGPDALGYPWRGAIHVHSSDSDGAAGI